MRKSDIFHEIGETRSCVYFLSYKSHAKIILIRPVYMYHMYMNMSNINNIFRQPQVIHWT